MERNLGFLDSEGYFAKASSPKQEEGYLRVSGRHVRIHVGGIGKFALAKNWPTQNVPFEDPESGRLTRPSSHHGGAARDVPVGLFFYSVALSSAEITVDLPGVVYRRKQL